MKTTTPEDLSVKVLQLLYKVLCLQSTQVATPDQKGSTSGIVMYMYMYMYMQVARVLNQQNAGAYFEVQSCSSTLPVP